MGALSLRKLLEENLPQESCRVFLYNDGIAILVDLTKNLTIYDLIRILDRICTLAETYLSLILTVGVGET